MRFGNHIDITLHLDDGPMKTVVKYNDNVIGGIQSVKFEASARAFGGHIDKFEITMLDPRDIYINDKQSTLIYEFIDEAKRCGAEVHIRSVFDTLPVDVEGSAEEDDGDGTAKIALACATLAGFGIAALFGSKGKKQEVQMKIDTAISTKK